MFLQLLLGSSQRVAVHDGPERLSKLGLRRQLAELALLSGQSVRVRRGLIGLGLLGSRRAPFGLHGV